MQLFRWLIFNPCFSFHAVNTVLTSHLFQVIVSPFSFKIQVYFCVSSISIDQFLVDKNTTIIFTILF